MRASAAQAVDGAKFMVDNPKRFSRIITIMKKKHPYNTLLCMGLFMRKPGLPSA